MNEMSQMLGKLSPEVSNIIGQVEAGNDAAVADAQAHAAFNQTAVQLSPEQFQHVAADAYTKMSPD